MKQETIDSQYMNMIERQKIHKEREILKRYGKKIVYIVGF